MRKPKPLRIPIQTQIGSGRVGDLSHRAPNGLCEDLVCALELRSTQLEQKTEELHRTKLRLKEISDLYAQLIELAPIGLFSLDERTRICEINDAMAKFLLRDKFSPIGEPFTMYVEPHDIPLLLSHLRRCRGTGARTTTDLHLQLAPRKPLVRITSFPFRLPKGQTHFRTAVLDLTYGSAIEEELLTSKSRYQNLVTVLPVAVLRYSKEGHCVYVNPFWEKLTGLDHAQAVAGGWSSVIHPEDQERVVSAHHRLFQAHVPFEDEYRLLRKDGLTTWVWAKGAIEKDQQAITGYTGVWIDITARRRAESALQESEGRFRTLYQSDILSIFFFSLRGTLFEANDAFLRLVGYERDELKRGAIRWLDLTPPSCRNRIAQALRELPATGLFHRFEGELLRKDGTVLPVMIGGALLTNSTSAAVAYVLDISNRKRAEIELAGARDAMEQKVKERTAELREINARLEQENRQRLTLEKELLEVSEKERQRIGRDLHDDLGQQLTGISFLSQALRQKIDEKSAINSDDIARIEQLVSKAIRHTRALAHGLTAVELGGQPLVRALQDLVKEINQLNNVNCRLVCKVKGVQIDPGTGGHLYNIVQEAINNALKHGQAQKIWISLTERREKLVVAVQNTGISFPRKSQLTDGIGLRTMKYRAQLLGASIKIEPGPAEGTIVRCAIPLSRLASGRARKAAKNKKPIHHRQGSQVSGRS